MLLLVVWLWLSLLQEEYLTWPGCFLTTKKEK